MLAEDNFSVNNYAVVCNFFVYTNWRNVTFLIESLENNNKMNNIVVNNYDSWTFFGDK